MSYIIISSVFIVLAFFAGTWVKKKEIENKYIKPTLCIATKKNKLTGKKAAITFYYDKEYFDYEEALFNPNDGEPVENFEDNTEEIPDNAADKNNKEDAA